MRIAILGSGMIGEIHRRAALLAGAEIVGVMASSPERSREVAARWGTSAILSIDDLTAESVDVVHVCTPNGLHVSQSTKLLNSGINVICEKPLATSVEDARLLNNLAKSQGLVATVPFVYRFHPLVREIRARAQAGEFGKWQVLHGSYLQDWLLNPQSTSWRVDSSQGGPSRAFADIGSHWCDLMEFVTGERIESVTAEFSTTFAERPLPVDGGIHSTSTFAVDTEDVAIVSFRTASGVIGSTVISQVSAGRKNRLWFEFDGAKKSAVFDQERPETIWLGSESSAEILQRDPNIGSPDQRRLSQIPAGHAQGYAQCFESFVADTYAAVSGETRDGLPTFADGERSAIIIDAVIEAARTGLRVEVSNPE